MDCSFIFREKFSNVYITLRRLRGLKINYSSHYSRRINSRRKVRFTGKPKANLKVSRLIRSDFDIAPKAIKVHYIVRRLLIREIIIKRATGQFPRRSSLKTRQIQDFFRASRRAIHARARWL